jgi:hypothetical protein
MCTYHIKKSTTMLSMYFLVLFFMPVVFL